MRFLSLRSLLIGSGIIILLVGGVLSGGLLTIRHLKQDLRATLEKTLHAQVAINGTLWLTLQMSDGWLQMVFQASDLIIDNQDPTALWTRISINQATGTFPISRVFSSSAPLEVRLQGWSILLSPLSAFTHSIGMNASTSAPPAPASANSAPSAQSDKFAVTYLRAEQGSVLLPLSDSANLEIAALTLEAERDSGLSQNWTMQAHADSITSPTFPHASLGPLTVQANVAENKLNLTQINLITPPGHVLLTGSIGLDAPHTTALTYKAEQMPIEPLLPSGWNQQLAGNLNSDGDVTASDSEIKITGKFQIDQARVKLLSFLQIPMLQLPNLGVVNLDQATGTFAWTPAELDISNLYLEKSSVARITGNGTILPDESINAQLKVGLPTVLFVLAPQLQTQLFPEVADGYAQAPVQITGTLDHPTNDLSAKLLAASLQIGSTLIQGAATQAQKTVQSVGQTASSLFNSLFSPAPVPPNSAPPSPPLQTPPSSNSPPISPPATNTVSRPSPP